MSYRTSSPLMDEVRGSTSRSRADRESPALLKDLSARGSTSRSRGAAEVNALLDGGKGDGPGPSVRRSLATPLDTEDERRLQALTTQPAAAQKEHAPHPPPAKKRKRKKPVITANMFGTRYDSVRRMAEKVGLTLSKDDDPNSYLIWYDSFVSSERIAELKPYQRINHYAGMGEITRKDGLARNMMKMQKKFDEEFNFHPRTWILPAEYNTLQTYAKELKKKKKVKTFISKPSTGAQGHGIQLFRNAERIPPSDHTIVQEYLDKPFLLDGYKFDLRIYVLVTSCDPLRIFLFQDGLVRLSTEQYRAPHESNVDRLYMHLTNYSINKHSDGYEKGTSVDTGSKRSIAFLNDYLRKNGYDVKQLWRNISDVIIKTMIVGQPFILHNYRMNRPGQAADSDSVCFEILGFDIFLDRKLRPYLLEINRSPSFGTDEQIDRDIKYGLLEDTFRLLNIKASDKRRNMAAQKAEAQRRLLKPFRRVDQETAEMEKKTQLVSRRKEQLRSLLTKVRKEASREEFENRNLGRFTRIFPPHDKFQQKKYGRLMTESVKLFLSGTSSLHKDVERAYAERLQEEEILDMLQQCEADEQEGRVLATTSSSSSQPPRRGPKPLIGMPVMTPKQRRRRGEDSEEELEDESDVDIPAAPLDRTPFKTDSSQSLLAEGNLSRPGSGRAGSFSRTGSRSHVYGSGSHARSRSLTRPQSSNRVLSQEEQQAREREDELTRKAMTQLNEMRIKFPGKTDAEAELILKKLHENWKFHKPRIASYWLVKLDSIKRRKVIDIVRSNVRASLQRVWRVQEVDSLRLARIFARVFNRLLWSNGQGLWNCFSQQDGNSWESIFSKSADMITTVELVSCRRVVQLCRECLLIVYQFASDTKAGSTAGDADTPHASHSAIASRSYAGFILPRKKAQKSPYNSVVSASGQPTWTPGQSISQRMSRIYNPGRLPFM